MLKNLYKVKRSILFEEQTFNLVQIPFVCYNPASRWTDVQRFDGCLCRRHLIYDFGYISHICNDILFSFDLMFFTYVFSYFNCFSSQTILSVMYTFVFIYLLLLLFPIFAYFSVFIFYSFFVIAFLHCCVYLIVVFYYPYMIRCPKLYY